MMKRFIAASCLLVGFAGAANAACPSYPYTLTNGTNADANQVMANFNNVITCANNLLAPIASPAFTGTVGISAPGSGAESLSVDGTISLGNSTEKISINSGSLGFNRRVAVGTIYNTSGHAYQIQHALSTNPGSDYLRFYTFSPGGAMGPTSLSMDALGRVGVNGDPNTSYTLFVTGTSAGLSAWTNASDGRLKKNVRQVTGAIAIVQQLRGVRYDWRLADERSVGKSLPLPTGEPQIGFIAQEVEKVVPEAVSKPKDASGFYGMRSENLIPVLVEAIKEQQVEIEQLKILLKAPQTATR